MGDRGARPRLDLQSGSKIEISCPACGHQKTVVALTGALLWLREGVRCTVLPGPIPIRVKLMKSYLRQLFAPILDIFESGEAEYAYKPSHRTILLAVGALFLLLSLASLVMAISSAQWAAGLPFVIFFCVGTVCAVVGALGTDRAVAKLWGNRPK